MANGKQQRRANQAAGWLRSVNLYVLNKLEEKKLAGYRKKFKKKKSEKCKKEKRKKKKNNNPGITSS